MAKKYPSELMFTEQPKAFYTIRIDSTYRFNKIKLNEYVLNKIYA